MSDTHKILIMTYLVFVTLDIITGLFKSLKMKKFISILLVFAALMGVSSVALAASFSRVDGTVTAVADDKSYIEAKLASGAQFIFRVDANSVFLSLYCFLDMQYAAMIVIASEKNTTSAVESTLLNR